MRSRQRVDASPGDGQHREIDDLGGRAHPKLPAELCDLGADDRVLVSDPPSRAGGSASSLGRKVGTKIAIRRSGRAPGVAAVVCRVGCGKLGRRDTPATGEPKAMAELHIPIDVDALGDAELGALFQATTRFTHLCTSLELHEHAVLGILASAFCDLLGQVTTEMRRRTQARRAVDGVDTVADLGWDGG
jgi:hypothetical protein